MSTANSRPSTVAGVSALALIFFCTIPSLSSTVRIFLVAKRNSWSEVYEDEDGVATEEDTATFSTRLPKFLIATLSFLSLTVSTAIAVLEPIGPTEENFSIENWLNAASWVVTFTYGIRQGFFLLITGSFSFSSKRLELHYQKSLLGLTSWEFTAQPRALFFLWYSLFKIRFYSKRNPTLDR
jgi:hypothetical protein